MAAFALTLGAADYATGAHLSFFPFYFIPIAIVASRHGAKAAYAFAVLCSAVWLVSDSLTGLEDTHPLMRYWNSVMRLGAFALVGYLVARIRTFLVAAQNEVKTLRGILPICGKCKRIRNADGYWQQMESYLSDHADVRFTHGLCEDCAAQALRELDRDETTRRGAEGDREIGTPRIRAGRPDGAQRS
jgi:hypothetical protein